MFDFHIHTTVSFDGYGTPQEMVSRAETLGLWEICFTDHVDDVPQMPEEHFAFDLEEYAQAYDGLTSQTVQIRKGMEFGLLPDNREDLARCTAQRPYDFVIGSVHCVDGMDIYYPQYWENTTVRQAEERYLQEVLSCIQAHDGFDVLGHLTYITKLKRHPTHEPMRYGEYDDLIDEIFKILIRKGKGIEVNTSGIDVCGALLPDQRYLLRFKELGGEAVTVGSDAHGPDRIGQYCEQTCRMVQDIFGYVCTFENRKPIFHKL